MKNNKLNIIFDKQSNNNMADSDQSGDSHPIIANHQHGDHGVDDGWQIHGYV